MVARSARVDQSRRKDCGCSWNTHRVPPMHHLIGYSGVLHAAIKIVAGRNTCILPAPRDLKRIAAHITSAASPYWSSAAPAHNGQESLRRPRLRRRPISSHRCCLAKKVKKGSMAPSAVVTTVTTRFGQKYREMPSRMRNATGRRSQERTPSLPDPYRPGE